ncbi:MAG TPA: MBOAT family O-acyltransferase [Candidatus Methylacidiphilales bacterium]
MLYTDTLFLLLLAAMVAVSRVLRPWPVVKEWVLIAFSLFVIASWGLTHLWIFCVVVLVNYAGAHGLARAVERGANRSARLWLAGLIAADVGALAFFKYIQFAVDNVSALLGRPSFHVPIGAPLAISFYTFHIISYLVDLRKGRVRPTTFREYLFYLSFFPHVIAGPIVRVWQLVPQIGKIRRVPTDWAIGLHDFAVGFFLKVAVANGIALLIDPLWTAAPAVSLSAPDRWAAAFLYYCQIYGDFAGYSLMALGMARLLGYRLPPNFRAPMLAASLQDFWRRWHITLSRWLRDYLYIPLGGNRVSPMRNVANVILVMALGGLWHGAGWGFLIWGLFHGTGIAAEHIARRRGLRLPDWATWLPTQVWVLLAWVFFRSPDLATGWSFAKGMFSWTDSSLALAPRFRFGLLLAVPILLHHAVPFLLRATPRRRLGLLLGAGTAIALLVDAVIYSSSETFVYFKF